MTNIADPDQLASSGSSLFAKSGYIRLVIIYLANHYLELWPLCKCNINSVFKRKGDAAVSAKCGKSKKFETAVIVDHLFSVVNNS